MEKGHTVELNVALIDPTFFLKVGILLVLAIFTLFTFVIFVQVRTMNKLVSQSFASMLVVVLSLGLLLFSISLFFLSLAIL